MSVLTAEQLNQVNQHNAFAAPVETSSNEQVRRRLPASAIDILILRDNPFILGKVDFKKFLPFNEDETENKSFDQKYAMIHNKKIAEIMVLLTCSKEELKTFFQSETGKELDESIFEYMDDKNWTEVFKEFGTIALALQKSNEVTAKTVDSEVEGEKK